jgi:hypothetical protein
LLRGGRLLRRWLLVRRRRLGIRLQCAAEIEQRRYADGASLRLNSTQLAAAGLDRRWNWLLASRPDPTQHLTPLHFFLL